MDLHFMEIMFDQIQSVEITKERFRVKNSIGRFKEGEFRKRIQFIQWTFKKRSCSPTDKNTKQVRLILEKH